VEAPEGTEAFAQILLSKIMVVSKVGLPRESKISRASTFLILGIKKINC